MLFEETQPSTAPWSRRLKREPEYFEYFNNGVTIVCDRVLNAHSRGVLLFYESRTRKIINGQQTTRVLADDGRHGQKARVLVRVIRIPWSEDKPADRFEQLVSQIVEATNWQNEIRASDLMANDRQQIVLERELRKLGYQYLRKRQTKGEARRAAGVKRNAPGQERGAGSSGCRMRIGSRRCQVRNGGPL